MNPSSDANSPLATLRQLKEMLDAGTLTPAEFEALKRQLIFGADETPAASAAPKAPAAAESVVASAPAGPVSTAPVPGVSLSQAQPDAAGPTALPATASREEPVGETDAFASAAAPLKPQDWMAALAPSMVPVIEADRVAAPDMPPAPDRRNPLALVFAIGGVLLLLAVFGYLLFGLPPKTDEHLSSTSQTPADTVRTRPDTGPQSEQLTLPPVAVPETVRVAPRVVRPVVPAAASTFRADSVVTPAKPAPVRSNPDQAVTRDTAVAPTKP